MISNRQPSGHSEAVPLGALLADVELATRPKQPPAPLSLTDEIAAHLKQSGLCRLSALRLLRNYMANPSHIALIGDARLRTLVSRYVSTGGLI